MKKIFENQGDLINSSLYKAKATRIQFKILNSNNDNKYNNSEWWIYYLNNISNNFGQSWTKALFFVVKFTLPVYLLYTISSGVLCILDCKFVWDNGKLLGYYFAFLNPAHKFNFMEKLGANNNLPAMFFDFFGRIGIGYGIYQLISAFRKHGKRG